MRLLSNPELNKYMDSAAGESLNNLPPYFELRVRRRGQVFQNKAELIERHIRQNRRHNLDSARCHTIQGA